MNATLELPLLLLFIRKFAAFRNSFLRGHLQKFLFQIVIEIREDGGMLGANCFLQ